MDIANIVYIGRRMGVIGHLNIKCEVGFIGTSYVVSCCEGVVTTRLKLVTIFVSKLSCSQ